MKITHLSQDLAPFQVDSPAAIGASELVSAQASAGDTLVVVAAAPAGGFAPPAYLARRLSPLRVETPGGAVDVIVMEGHLPGSRARLFLLGLPEGAPRTVIFGRAALTLLPTVPDRPDLIHLHDDTGCDLDGLRMGLDGTTVVQSVYDAGSDSPTLVAAIQDADAVVVPCSGLAEAASGRAVAEALKGLSHPRVALLGVDTVRWNPARDTALAATFSPEALSGKTVCREALQKRAGFPPRSEALILALWAKHPVELDGEALAELVGELRRLDFQIVLLGPEGGAADPLHRALRDGSLGWVVPDASEGTLRAVLGGADAMLLPDPVAPLGQRALVAMRYGLVPVACRVQANQDHLVEHDVRSGTGGAFLYQSSEELLRALNRLAKVHRDVDGWSSMVRANALVDSGWSRPLSHLKEIYRKALAK